MTTFSGTQQLPKDSTEGAPSMFIYMKKISQALQVQELEEENEVLKTEILQLHTDVKEAAEGVSKKIVGLISAERETERERVNREMNEIVSELTDKINSTRNLYNEDYFKFNEFEKRFKTLEENYEPCLRRLCKKIKATIEKEKETRKECDIKLKEKEEIYEAREKELKEQICKLEQEIKEKTEKITEILEKEKNSDELPPPKCDLIKRSFSSDNGDDDISSCLSCYNEAYKVETKQTYKYCGRRSSNSIDQALAYRHLRKTRTSIRITDSESLNDEKRQKKILK